MDIKQVAVLGSGVMGSGIAGVLANAGIPVLLLDMKEAGEHPNARAEGAIEKQLKGSPPGFVNKKASRLVTPGNFDDDLKKLAECDWIIEVVVEKLEIKQDVYRKVDAVRKKGSIVSSNTSTLPLHVLLGGMPQQFQNDFLITHFFNPPRFMKLLEVVPSPSFDAARFAAFSDFADRHLGKNVVPAKDTPGFLGNRIGVYWLTVALLDAIRMNIRVEEADAVMGKPLGFPKTGIFGLYDLIGIDLMPLIAQAMLSTLPESDAFRKIFAAPELVTRMIADGYTGRKGKGGFYRIVKAADGSKTKEVVDLQTGQYRSEQKARLESVNAAKDGIAALFSHKDIGGQYAASVMLKTLHYAASLIPEISDDIAEVDAAMRTGYSWKYGPFQMIDRLAAGDKSGTEVLAEFFQQAGLSVPPLIEKAKGKKLYEVESGIRKQFNIGGQYKTVPIPDGSLTLEDIKITGAKPVKKNVSASVWDLGDGIACLELTSKSNTWDPENLRMVAELPDIVKGGFRGAVVGGDADHFSFGANIGYFLLACNTASWWAISDMVKQGQAAFMGIKYSNFPVVSALSGMALGGGCELNLHVDAVAADIESYIGLVEAGIGVIPGWGGCKEMVWRHLAAGEAAQKSILSGKRPEVIMSAGPMGGVAKAFEYISMAKVAGSAAEAKEMLILNNKSKIVMNRRRVLAEAKRMVLEMSHNYAPPEPRTFRLPGESGYVALKLAVDGFRKNGKATPHDEVVSLHLARVLTGGDTDLTQEVTEQQMLDLEHEHFMQLCKHPDTQARIAHMLNTSKPLRN